MKNKKTILTKWVMLLFMFGFLSIGGNIHAQSTACPEPTSYDYVSVKDGSYTTGSTWAGGSAPSGSGKNILITHTVTAGSNLIPNSGSTIVVKNGGHLKAGKIQTDSSNTTIILNGGYLETTNGFLQITTSSSSICAINSCIIVEEDFQFEKGSNMYFEDTGIYVHNGNLQSKSYVTGSDIRVKLRNGNFEKNGGTWAGNTVSAWYASGGQSGFSGLPPKSSSSMEPCNVTLQCYAGDIAPPVQNLSNDCPLTRVNLSGAHTGTIPAGAEIRWFTNNQHTGTALTGSQIEDAGAGTYYAFYYDSTNNCWSPVSDAVHVVIDNCPTIDCADGEITYTLDIAATKANNTISPNGGVLNLTFSKTSGPDIPGMANSFTVPVTYSGMNNTMGTGAVNEWEGLGNVTAPIGELLIILPKTTNTSGGIYHNLPLSNQVSLPFNANANNADKTFDYYLGIGTLQKTGNFNIEFGEFPNSYPAGVTVKEQFMSVRQTGNVSNGFDYFKNGYFLKPELQNNLRQADNSGATDIFPVEPGQTYTYWYSAFDNNEGDGLAVNAGVRGAGIFGYLTLCYDEDLCNAGTEQVELDGTILSN